MACLIFFFLFFCILFLIQAKTSLSTPQVELNASCNDLSGFSRCRRLVIRGWKFDGLDQDETRCSRKQAKTEVEGKRRWQSCTEPDDLVARAGSVKDVEQMTFF